MCGLLKQQFAVIDPAQLCKSLKMATPSTLQLSQQGVTSTPQTAVDITHDSISCNTASTGDRHIRYINSTEQTLEYTKGLISRQLTNLQGCRKVQLPNMQTMRADLMHSVQSYLLHG